MYLTVSDHATIMSYIKTDNKVAAIKKLREATGLGLREAKEQVEYYMEHGSWKEESNYDHTKFMDSVNIEHIDKAIDSLMSAFIFSYSTEREDYWTDVIQRLFFIRSQCKFHKKEE